MIFFNLSGSWSQFFETSKEDPATGPCCWCIYWKPCKWLQNCQRSTYIVFYDLDSSSFLV